MKVLGKFKHIVKTDAADKSKLVKFVVTKHPFNLLNIMALYHLQVNINSLIHAASDGMAKINQQIKVITTQQEEVEALQKVCHELCKEFFDLFKPELGCLMDYKLETKFKPDMKSIYYKPLAVPLLLLDDLNQVYEAGIKKGIWIPNSTNMVHL